MKKSLLMDVKVGESLVIDGGRIVITLEEKSGQRSKLRIVHEGASVTRAGSPPEPDRRLTPRTGPVQARLGTKVAA